MSAREITNLGSPFSVAIDRLDARQYYLVDGLFDVDDVDEAIVQGLPQPSTTISIGSSASMVVRRLTRKRVLTTISQGAQGHAVIWEGESSRYFSGSLGYRRTSELREGVSEQIGIPNFRKYDAVFGGNAVYVEIPEASRFRVLRKKLVAIHILQTSGILEADVITFNGLNGNKYRIIGTVPFLYEHTNLRTTPDNQQTVEVFYRTLCAISAYPVTTLKGYDVAVPALPILGQYTVEYPKALGDPGVIGVETYDKIYLPCPAVPWDP